MGMNFGPTVCPVCDGYVYFAEELRAVGKSFHKQCFRCDLCAKMLDSFTVAEHKKKLYCRNCYAKMLGPHVYRSVSTTKSQSSSLERRSQSQPRQTGDSSPHYSTYRTADYDENGYYSSRNSPLGKGQVALWVDPTGSGYRPSRPRWANASIGGVRCANCSDTVFANERVDVVGKTFHRLCFKCASCGRLLDRGSVCDHNREVFCQKCYTKHFGSTGFKAGTNLRCA